MDAQVIRTSSGEELVVVPRADYDALVRRANLAPPDAQDGALARRALAHVEAEADTQIPDAVWRQLQAGGSRLRILRSWRGMTQQELGLEAGVTQTTIYNAERAGAVGSRYGLKLARALRVPIEVLIGAD